METQSILKKTLLAGLGVYSLSREKAQEFMDDLVKRGELSKDEGSKFVKAMVDKAEEETAFVKKMIDERINQVMSVIRPSVDEEIKRLEDKIDALTKEVKKMSKN